MNILSLITSFMLIIILIHTSSISYYDKCSEHCYDIYGPSTTNINQANSEKYYDCLFCCFGLKALMID